MNNLPGEIVPARPDAKRLFPSLDPRLMLAAALLYIGVISGLPHGAWSMYALAGAFIPVVVGLSGLPLRPLCRRSLVVLPIAGLAAVSVLFTMPGREMFSLTVLRLHLEATREGGVGALSLLAKAYLSVLMGSALTASVGFTRVIEAMAALHMPRLLTRTIAFGFRYLHVLANESIRMLRARDSRSAGSGRTILWRARILGAMIGTLFLRTLSRSERIYYAMQARGFDGEIVVPVNLRWTRRDTAAAVVWALPLAGIAVGSRVIYG